MMIMSRMLLSLLCFVALVYGQASPDTATMLALRDSLQSTRLNWSDPNPCLWTGLGCDRRSHRVTRIQIGNTETSGALTSDLRNLSSLTVFEVMGNKLTGKIPSLAGLKSLQRVFLNDNGFTTMDADFFTGLHSLHYVNLDNNPLRSWEIPSSLRDANSLLFFSAVNCNLSGTIPDHLTLPNLTSLELSGNHLVGELPVSFAESRLQILKLDGQKLNGSISVLQKMPLLTEVSLHGNRFSGTIPDLSGLTSLRVFDVSENQLTGGVPNSLIALVSLTYVALGNNLLQGSTPLFLATALGKNITVNTTGLNSFCLDIPNIRCDPRINALLSIIQEFGLPRRFAESWKGNNPCDSTIKWVGITCTGPDITAINFRGMGLTGIISTSFARLEFLQVIDLSQNNLTGFIPGELSTLRDLNTLDVSYNPLMYDGIPCGFRPNVVVTGGNPDSEQFVDAGVTQFPPPVVCASNSSSGSKVGKIVGCVVGVVLGLLVIGFAVFFLLKKKRQHHKNKDASSTAF